MGASHALARDGLELAHLHVREAGLPGSAEGGNTEKLRVAVPHRHGGFVLVVNRVTCKARVEVDFFRFVGGVVAHQLEERLHPCLCLQLLLRVRNDEVSKQSLLNGPPSDGGDMQRAKKGEQKKTVIIIHIMKSRESAAIAQR